MKRASALLLFALAACNRAPETQPTPTPTRATATPTPAPMPSAAPAADLLRYVGRYPFDPVAGTRFVDDPAVRQAVARAVPDAKVRDTVLGRDATANPVAQWNGRVLAWACEAHNCGPHNWAIAITPDGRNAAICYYDQDAGVSRWYPAGFRAPLPDGCPSGE